MKTKADSDMGKRITVREKPVTKLRNGRLYEYIPIRHMSSYKRMWNELRVMIREEIKDNAKGRHPSYIRTLSRFQEFMDRMQESFYYRTRGARGYRERWYSFIDMIEEDNEEYMRNKRHPSYFRAIQGIQSFIDGLHGKYDLF